MSGQIDGARSNMLGMRTETDAAEGAPAAPAGSAAADPAPAAPGPPAAPGAVPGRMAAAASIGSGGPKPRGASDAPRAGADIAIGNPFTNAAVHASHYAAVNAAMAYGLEKLAAKYPDVNRSFAARFLELAVSTGAQAPVMVYSHEMGHYHEAKALGADPKIEMTGWMSGLTYYNLPPGVRPTREQGMVVDAAGVNQQTQNAMYMFERFARNSGARYQAAMGYLLAQTNMALYAANTARREMQGPIRSSDDIANYIETLNEKGNDLRVGHLAAIALATDLMSAPVWATLIGQVRFLVNGDRHVEMPTIEIGDVKATFPNFHTLLSSNGPIVGGTVMIDPDKKVPVEVSFSVRLDKEKAAALGGKLFDIPIGTDRVTVNPFLRGTYDARTGAGVEVGADVRAKVRKDIAVTGTVSFQTNDLLAEPMSKPEGFSARVGLSIPF